jgi:hypothetical protein
MRRVAIVMGFLLLAGCRHCLRNGGVGTSTSVTQFTTSDAPPVDVGRYPGPLRMLSSDHPLSVKAASLRTDVESHEQVLRELVRGRISVKSPLEFQFMYVGHDSLNQQLILRYFSRADDQREFAGWQVQLVYSLPSLQPVHAYVQSVPLE